MKIWYKDEKKLGFENIKRYEDIMKIFDKSSLLEEPFA